MSNFGFYISGSSERLKRFIRQASAEKRNAIKIVVSEYDIEMDLEQLLEKEHIPYRTVKYSELGGTNIERNLKLSNILLKELSAHRIDYCFSFGKHILSGEILDKYRNRIINFHPSLLPMYPGVNAIDQAVKEGKALLIGNTAHVVDEGVDSGPIIMQSVIPMQAFTDTKDYNVILDLQIEMLNQLMEIIDEGNLLEIEGGGVRIKDADYAQGTTFPVRNKKDSKGYIACGKRADHMVDGRPWKT